MFVHLSFTTQYVFYVHFTVRYKRKCEAPKVYSSLFRYKIFIEGHKFCLERALEIGEMGTPKIDTS